MGMAAGLTLGVKKRGAEMPPLSRLVSSEVYEKEVQNRGPSIPSDQELLDTYSRTVVQVAEQAGLSMRDCTAPPNFGQALS